MTKVLLTRLWIHDAANLSDCIDVFVLDEGETTAAKVQLREYAGGRRRAVTAPGTARTIPLALRSLPRESYYRIRDLIDDGREVMIRLPRGRKLWGTIAGITVTEHRRVDRIDSATLTVQEVSHVEGITSGASVI